MRDATRDSTARTTTRSFRFALVAAACAVTLLARDAGAQDAGAQDAGARGGAHGGAHDAEPASIEVSSRVVGRTPGRIGYVLGDVLPGSNVTGWLRYSGMNAGRLWWSHAVWPAPPEPWEGQGDLARFEAAREDLRRNVETAIDWGVYRDRVAETYGGRPEGIIGDSFVLSELHGIGAVPLLMMSHPRRAMPFETADGSPDWFGRWTYWRGIYANAFYLANTYGVERFQLFNEPDHPASGFIPQAEYLARLQVGSDAVQAAIADVNRRYGKDLHVKVSAPVTAGMMIFDPRAGREDTRDREVGWGQLVTRSRHADFPGRGDYNEGLFNVYAFQNYTRSPGSISDRLPGLIEAITRADGGVRMPVIISEMNVSTAASFSKTDDSLDTPAYYAAFGATAAAYVNAGIDEVYVFRHTQTANLGGGAIKKNGTHYLDNADPRKDITGSTKSAEAARLFMRGLSGGRERFAAPHTSQADLYAAAARDEEGVYTLMVTNLSGRPRDVSLDLSAWPSAGGALAVAEEVSEAHHGDVSGVAAVPDDGRLSLPMRGRSVHLLTLRPGMSTTPAVAPVEASEGVWSVERPAATGRLNLLTFSASATDPPRRIRVYGGAGDPARADLLGQVVPADHAGSFTVDATRYVAAAGVGPLVFQIVNEAGGTDSFELGQLRLHTFGSEPH